jgi:hypothetical protein
MIPLYHVQLQTTVYLPLPHQQHQLLQIRTSHQNPAAAAAQQPILLQSEAANRRNGTYNSNPS